MEMFNTPYKERTIAFIPCSDDIVVSENNRCFKTTLGSVFGECVSEMMESVEYGAKSSSQVVMTTQITFNNDMKIATVCNNYSRGYKHSIEAGCVVVSINVEKNEALTELAKLFNVK